MRPLTPMVVLLNEDEGVSESQFVAVDQIAAVLPITRRNGVGITFTDGSEVHLRSGAVLRTSMKPRKVVAQMTAVLLMNEDGDQ